MPTVTGGKSKHTRATVHTNTTSPARTCRRASLVKFSSLVTGFVPPVSRNMKFTPTLAPVLGSFTTSKASTDVAGMVRLI